MVRRAGSAWRDYPDTTTPVTAQDYKDYSDALDSAVGPSRIRPLTVSVVPTADITIPSFTLVYANTDWAAEYDPDGMFTAGSPSTITIPAGQGGAYLLSLTARFDAGTGNQLLRVFKNGSANANIVSETMNTLGGAVGKNALQSIEEIVLAGGDVLRWGFVTSANVSLTKFTVYGSDTTQSATRVRLRRVADA